MTRTCRALIATAIALLIGSCSFDPGGLGAVPAAGTDAAIVDGGPGAQLDGATRALDAAPKRSDARPPPDAHPPDATPDASVDACGGILQACCDPGATCRGLAACIGGTCVGL